jgi:hypothetical protein
LAVVRVLAGGEPPASPSASSRESSKSEARKDEPKSAAPAPATEKPKEAPKPAPAQRVISGAKARQTIGKSPFLRPPGMDRYDSDPVDWNDVPAWRQASFFGIRAQGQFFIYVVDCSGSMSEEGRLERAKAEVRRSVLALREPQRFKVIFYNDEPLPMPGDVPQSAGLTSKNQLMAWMNLIQPDGGTDPRAALGEALGHRPDAVFLLSDGEYPEGTVEAVARKNPRKVPIHCVDLSGGAAGDQLRRIARESGGQYLARP